MKPEKRRSSNVKKHRDEGGDDMRSIERQNATTDLAVIAAGAALDHPGYVIEELIEQGLMPEVYRALAKRLHGRALSNVPVSEISAVVLEVIEKRDASGREAAATAPTDEEDPPMFPYYEPDDRFPDPLAESSLDTEDASPVADAKRAAGRSASKSSEEVLHAVNGVVERWKKGMSGADGAMSEIASVIARAR